MTTVTTDKVGFSGFGKIFQERVVQALLNDKKWAASFDEVLNYDYFDLEHLKFIVSNYFSHYKKYKDFPSMQVILEMAKEQLVAEKEQPLRMEVYNFFQRMSKDDAFKNDSDLEYYKQKAFEFCKMQSIKAALEKSVDLIESGKYDEVPSLMKKAIMTGEVSTIGHDIVCDLTRRYSAEERKNIVATGLPELDNKYVLNGGLGAGELGCIMALSGRGKSHFLVHLATEALKQKKNVVYYTFELSENAIGIRADSNLCDINSSDIIDFKSVVEQHYEMNKENYGRFMIKEYPTNSATVNTIKTHLEKLSLVGFKPDLLLIDYADIMRSTSRYDQLRLELKLIFEELRSLAMEFEVPIWTATQSNRDGMTSEVIGMGNMSEAYGKAFVCDVIISLNQKETELASNLAKLFVVKNRRGKDGMLFPVFVDKSKSRFKILADVEEEVMNSVSGSGSHQPSLKEMFLRRSQDLKPTPQMLQNAKTIFIPGKSQEDDKKKKKN